MSAATQTKPGRIADNVVTPTWPQHDRSGVWLTDENGRRTLSLFCAGGVFNFGFNAREIGAEIAALMAEHDVGIWLMPSERRAQGERDYARILPSPLTRTFFASSGSEAFEVACKLAKRITGRHNLVSVTGGYYGHLGFSLAMDDPSLEPQHYTPLAGGIGKAVHGSIESLSELVDENTAAVCLETVQVPAGVIPLPEGYLAQVRRLCDERGALLIVDEVQGGLCRTGRMWAIDHHGVAPDLLIAGKGLTAGYYPVGAVSFREEFFEYTVADPRIHRSSYSGSEIVARAVGIVARRYSDPALCRHVNAVGAQLKSGLATLVERFPNVLMPEIRGLGLLYGLDVTDPNQRGRLLQACRAAGLYIKPSSIRNVAIVLQPPLVISEQEVCEALNRFEEALTKS